jgi:hypothetical protein
VGPIFHRGLWSDVSPSFHPPWWNQIKRESWLRNFFSINQNLMIKQYEKNLVVLWIIGILRVLAEIEFKFSNMQYWHTMNEQLVSINLESNPIEIVQCQILKVFCCSFVDILNWESNKSKYNRTEVSFITITLQQPITHSHPGSNGCSWHWTTSVVYK